MFHRQILGWVLLILVMAASSAGALEVGQPAPEFKLPSTTGVDIALGDFKGKKWVFLEFYGADFAPTWAANLSARKANYASFEALGVQILAVSNNVTFSQQTFAESLKLPFPLLSDFPNSKTLRAYGVFSERAIATRTFFLIDPQGVIRKKWLIENPSTTVVYSNTILAGIREVMGKTP